MADPLLHVEGLTKYFQRGRATIKALDGVDFLLEAGQALALVGASGCGKSTLVRCIVQLEFADAGRVTFAGRDWTRAKSKELVQLWRQVQLVFQAPQAAFDPRWSVGASLDEPLCYLRPELDASARKKEVARLLELVELAPSLASRFPRELSGGQLQRVALARALAPRPRLLIADEPTSALDTVTRRQVLRLVADLRRREGLGLIWVTHDLLLVPHVCDRCAVMVEGKIVEEIAADALGSARHPQTQALRDAADIGGRER